MKILREKEAEDFLEKQKFPVSNRGIAKNLDEFNKKKRISLNNEVEI